MEKIEKLRILLQHWIDHSKGHAAEFETWRQTMIEEGRQEVADLLQHAMDATAAADGFLEQALEQAGGRPEHPHSHDHPHHHHHE